jgi:hypothetical protein
MNSEYQQAPLERLFFNLVPPGEQEPIGWAKAKSLVDLCSEIDHDVNQVTIHDERLVSVKNTIRDSAASPAYNDILADRVIDYLRPDGTTRFDSMVERLGICFDEGSLGIYTPEGAKTQELRALLIFGPTVVEYAGRTGQVDLVRRELKQQRVLSQSFLWHYKERFDDPDNIAKFLPSPESQNRWYRRRKRMNLFTIFPADTPVPWKDEPEIFQEELLVA